MPVWRYAAERIDTGDAARGRFLIVWAVGEGGQVAKHIDQWLMGRTELP